jgi:hypothetical protein
MPALREVFAVFGVQFDSRQMLAGAKNVDALAKRLGDFSRVVMGGYVAKSIVQFVTRSADMARTVGRSARAVDMSTDAWQEWSYAALQSGVQGQNLVRGLQNLSRSAVEAQRRGGAARAEMIRLGALDTAGELRPTGDMIEAVAGSIAALPTHAERAATVMRLFGGRMGRDLIPLFSRGPEGLARLREEFRTLGGGLPPEMIERSQEFGRALRQWQVSSQTLRAQFALAFLPTLTAVLSKIARFTGELRRIPGFADLVMRGLQLVGIVAAAVAVRAAVAWAASIWPLLLAAAALAVLYLTFNEIRHTLDGQNTALQEMIDHLLGVGATAEMIQGLRDAWLGLHLAIYETRVSLAELFGLEPPEVPRSLEGIARPVPEYATERGVGGPSPKRRIGPPRIAEAKLEAARGPGRHGPAEAAPSRAYWLRSGAGRRREVVEMMATARGVRIDARTNNVITVNEAGDPAETQRVVREEIRAANDAQIRNVRARLVPAATR